MLRQAEPARCEVGGGDESEGASPTAGLGAPPAQTSPDVAVFWDVRTCPPSQTLDTHPGRGAHAADLVESVRRALSEGLGRVVALTAYGAGDILAAEERDQLARGGVRVTLAPDDEPAFLSMAIDASHFLCAVAKAAAAVGADEDAQLGAQPAAAAIVVLISGDHALRDLVRCLGRRGARVLAVWPRRSLASDELASGLGRDAAFQPLGWPDLAPLAVSATGPSLLPEWAPVVASFHCSASASSASSSSARPEARALSADVRGAAAGKQPSLLPSEDGDDGDEHADSGLSSAFGGLLLEHAQHMQQGEQSAIAKPAKPPAEAAHPPAEEFFDFEDDGWRGAEPERGGGDDDAILPSHLNARAPVWRSDGPAGGPAPLAAWRPVGAIGTRMPSPPILLLSASACVPSYGAGRRASLPVMDGVAACRQPPTQQTAHGAAGVLMGMEEGCYGGSACARYFGAAGASASCDEYGQQPHFGFEGDAMGGGPHDARARRQQLFVQQQQHHPQPQQPPPISRSGSGFISAEAFAAAAGLPGCGHSDAARYASMLCAQLGAPPPPMSGGGGGGGSCCSRPHAGSYFGRNYGFRAQADGGYGGAGCGFVPVVPAARSSSSQPQPYVGGNLDSSTGASPPGERRFWSSTSASPPGQQEEYGFGGAGAAFPAATAPHHSRVPSCGGISPQDWDECSQRLRYGAHASPVHGCSADVQQLAALLPSSFEAVASGSEQQLRKLRDIFGDVPALVRFLAMQCRCDQTVSEMTRALTQNLDMPSDGVLVSLVQKFLADVAPKVRVDLHRASDAGLLVLSGHRHTEWVTPSPAARQLRPRPYGRHVPIGRLFSGNPTQMQWLKDVFGDVSTLFHFLLTEVRVKGTLPASVPPNALPKGKLINFCTGSHVHFDFDAAIRTQLVAIGGRPPYEWVRIAAADSAQLGSALGFGARQLAPLACSHGAYAAGAQPGGGY